LLLLRIFGRPISLLTLLLRLLLALLLLLCWLVWLLGLLLTLFLTGRRLLLLFGHCQPAKRKR
jgi:hypothetical protein